MLPGFILVYCFGWFLVSFLGFWWFNDVLVFVQWFLKGLVRVFLVAFRVGGFFQWVSCVFIGLLSGLYLKIEKKLRKHQHLVAVETSAFPKRCSVIWRSCLSHVWGLKKESRYALAPGRTHQHLLKTLKTNNPSLKQALSSAKKDQKSPDSLHTPNKLPLKPSKNPNKTL